MIEDQLREQPKKDGNTLMEQLQEIQNENIKKTLGIKNNEQWFNFPWFQTEKTIENLYNQICEFLRRYFKPIQAIDAMAFEEKADGEITYYRFYDKHFSVSYFDDSLRMEIINELSDDKELELAVYVQNSTYMDQTSEFPNVLKVTQIHTALYKILTK